MSDRVGSPSAARNAGSAIITFPPRQYEYEVESSPLPSAGSKKAILLQDGQVEAGPEDSAVR